MWDINTEIQDINSERGLQGEAGDQNLNFFFQLKGGLPYPYIKPVLLLIPCSSF